MQKTPKLGLNKPELTDYVTIADLNENMDKLDDAVGKLQEGTTVIPELETEDKTLSGAINEVKNDLDSYQTKTMQQITDVKSDTTSIKADTNTLKTSVAAVKSDTEKILAKPGGKVLRSKVFKANGTFVVPSGVTEVYLTGCGAGGGGGRGGAGGGGAGDYIYDFPVAVTPNTSVSVIVGSVGLGGTNSNPTGKTGGSTSFGALLTLVGGGGNISSSDIAPGAGAGGDGGSIRGGNGGIEGGNGGSGFSAGGPGGMKTGTAGGYGAGGSGGGAVGGHYEGGNGGPGLLIVKWWE